MSDIGVTGIVVGNSVVLLCYGLFFFLLLACLKGWYCFRDKELKEEVEFKTKESQKIKASSDIRQKYRQGDRSYLGTIISEGDEE